MGDLKTLFSDAVCPTPDAGSGFSGTPGGLDQGPGPNGLTNTPWDNPVVPTPSGEMTPSSDLGGPPIKKVDTGGGTHEGESLADDITRTPLRTVDEK
jgi:hypothetical protein